MLISMEIFILLLLVRRTRPPPLQSGQGGLPCHATALTLAPCCAQASRDYQSEADVSIIPRHRRALLPSFFTTHTYTPTDLSDDGLITLCKLSPVSHFFFFFSGFIILTFHKTVPLPFLQTFCYRSAFSPRLAACSELLLATSKENQGSQSHRHGI